MRCLQEVGHGQSGVALVGTMRQCESAKGLALLKRMYFHDLELYNRMTRLLPDSETHTATGSASLRVSQ